jgi:hypothetical protein
MEALGKALAFSTLAFGTLGWQSGGDWQRPYSNSEHKDSKASYTSHNKDEHQSKDYKFYQLSWEERQKLCKDDAHWDKWSWLYEKNRDKYCAEEYGYKSKTHESSNNKYAKHESQQKHDEYTSDDSWHKGYGGSNHKSGHKDYGHGGDKSVSYVADYSHEKQAAASNSASLDQSTVVNNYTYVSGNNNVVNNNISVVTAAAQEQQASGSEVTVAAVEYKASEDNYGGHKWDGQDVSYEATLYEEKSEASYSQASQVSSYEAHESYSQTSDDHEYGYQPEHWQGWDGQRHSTWDEKCDPCKDDCYEYKDDCYDKQDGHQYQQQGEDCYSQG